MRSFLALLLPTALAAHAGAALASQADDAIREIVSWTHTVRMAAESAEAHAVTRDYAQRTVRAAIPRVADAARSLAESKDIDAATRDSVRAHALAWSENASALERALGRDESVNATLARVDDEARALAFIR